MSRYVPLSKTRHAHAGLRAAGLDFALDQAVVPLVAEELPHVLPTMAVAFVRNEQTGAFELVALQSLQCGGEKTRHAFSRLFALHREIGGRVTTQGRRGPRIE